MSQEYCKSKRDFCDPRDCNREYCPWRDTEWAIKNMKLWSYVLKTKPEEKSSDQKVNQSKS